MFIRLTLATALLLSAAATNASHWVSGFSGSASQYRVIRHEETIELEQLMLLEVGDTVMIDDPAGRVSIVDERNERRNLTPKDSPFVVPKSEPPPQLLTNVRHWVASWWNTRGNQSTSSMAAVSKGGLDPKILGVSSTENFLLSGSRRLHLVWRGGIQPFDVSLVAESGKILERCRDISNYSASFPIVELQNGQYRIELAAGAAESNITFTAVGMERLPDPANAILDLDLPDEIRFGYLAMLLSAYSSWRFEALQLAHFNNLTQLELDLLAGSYPESDIGEMTSMPDPSETAP